MKNEIGAVGSDSDRVATPMTSSSSHPIEILPCPFCGGAAMFGEVEDESSPDFGGHFIHCTELRCSASTNLRFASGDDPRPLLAEQWNRRALLFSPALSPAIEAARRKDAEWFLDDLTHYRSRGWQNDRPSCFDRDVEKVMALLSRSTAREEALEDIIRRLLVEMTVPSGDTIHAAMGAARAALKGKKESQE